VRLVLIYGPPAVGKLTVARELSRLTGLPVFDNHLSFDCVSAVFGFESAVTGPLVERIRHLVIGEAARQGTSLIFTFVYRHPHDDGYLERLCDVVEREGGTVDFVQLDCDVPEQERRVTGAHRTGRNLDTVERLREWAIGREVRRAFPHRPALFIDNTYMAAVDVARQIARALSLESTG
jgi:hypothetical protein